ncbi:MAG: polysaccharide biosynthesis tyrosine autokinase [Acidimicrobiia bacterium]|nr:polysaccharide biosynthesis tyrosine autokinase [Acidimicrobiia bacterium]
MNSERYPELDPRHVLYVLSRRVWLIAGLVLVGFASVFLVSNAQTERYEATAEVQVVQSTGLGGTSGSRADADRNLSNEMYLMRSGVVRGEVASRLGSDVAFDRVQVREVPETDVVRLTVTSPSPEQARDAANTFATVYIEQRQLQVAEVFNQRAADLEAFADRLTQRVAEIDTLLALGPPAAEVDALTAERTGLIQQQTQFLLRAAEFRADADLRRDGVEVIEVASLPTDPVSPKPLRDGLVGGLIGLVLGIGLAFLLEWLDNRLRIPEQLEAVPGAVPVIGTIPMYDVGGGRFSLGRGQRTERALVPLDSPAAEAYRTLQTSLRFSSLGKTKQRIAVTSSSGGEGKTTVTANLAMVLAESGLRVVVISCDLRRPTIGSIFGVDETEKGLTSILLGDASPADCLVPITFDSGRSLYLLPAGPLPHNPAELLGSPAFGPLLERIEAAGVDFILLDCAPVLPVSDPLAVAQNVDGVIMLAMAERTKQGSYVQALDRLHQVQAQIIGTVLNGMPTKRGYYGYYGYYGYGRYGGYASRQPSRPASPAGGSKDSPNGHKGEAPNGEATAAPAPPAATPSKARAMFQRGVTSGRATGRPQAGNA